MAFQTYRPSEMGRQFPDAGGNGLLYEITSGDNKNDEFDVLYDSHMQQTALIQANVVSVFCEWIQSFFPPNYFKFMKITTQSPFKELREWYKDIYKKEKPFMVIDPQPPEIAEDSIFARRYFNQFNDFDPGKSGITFKLTDALPVLENDACALVYRRNRLHMQFNIMIMEQTMARQQDSYNRMIMSMPHSSKLVLTRTVPVPIPTKFVSLIANLRGMDARSDEFLSYLNTISQYPIKKEIRNNKTIVFFMIQQLNCHVEIPSYPAKDTPEKSEAIEWGARITDLFIFTQDLPMEFIFLVKKERINKASKVSDVTEDENTISFISPLYADLDWPLEFGDYKFTNRVDVEIQEGDDNTLDLLPLIRDNDKQTYSIISEYVKRGFDVNDLLMARVFPNGSYREHPSILHRDGIFEIISPRANKLYTINLYVNHEAANLIAAGQFSRQIGTIETEALPE